MQFSATGGISYIWSGPASYSAVGANPDRDTMNFALAGTYTVVGTDSFGCTGTSNTIVSVMQCPEICGNGVDDDFDGQTDAQDLDCCR